MNDVQCGDAIGLLLSVLQHLLFIGLLTLTAANKIPTGSDIKYFMVAIKFTS